MFIRARATKGQTYYQLVRGYRDEAGIVRQETLGLGRCASVQEALDIELEALHVFRRKRQRSSAVTTDRARQEFERYDKRVARCEAKIAKLEAALSDTTNADAGQSEDPFRLDLEGDKKIAPEVLNKIKGTHLDTGAYLDLLKKLMPHEQHRAAERDLRIGRRQRRNALPRVPVAASDNNDGPLTQKLKEEVKAAKEGKRTARQDLRIQKEETERAQQEAKRLRDEMAFLRQKVELQADEIARPKGEKTDTTATPHVVSALRY